MNFRLETRKFVIFNSMIKFFLGSHLILKVEAGDLDEMRALMLKIREIPNVATSELITVFKVWKEKNA